MVAALLADARVCLVLAELERDLLPRRPKGSCASLRSATHGAAHDTRETTMPILRMDNVLIVVDDPTSSRFDKRRCASRPRVS
jgi:hypothetical protein